MGAGAYLEPLAVILLLFGGAWINRAPDYTFSIKRSRWQEDSAEVASASPDLSKADSFKDTEAQALFAKNISLSPSLLTAQTVTWRARELKILSWRKEITSPNTAVFQNRLLSRLLHKFPFLVEAWYWILIYWVYQLGRAFTAVTLVEGTIHVARRHALELIEIEKKLHIFWELPIQRFFMGFTNLMPWINYVYSFIHIPGTIAFLVGLYYYTVTCSRLVQHRDVRLIGRAERSPSGPALYEARRRTMAICNLLAFVVFTIWPCMPPRLLSDPSYNGASAESAKAYGFVDTVHREERASSVWTQNKFCNQYAAMPSLHFGYSLMIGLTIISIPLASEHEKPRSVHLPFFNNSHPDLAPRITLPSTRRLVCILFGFLYPFSIMVAIVATANHALAITPILTQANQKSQFILDAVAGAIVCLIGWNVNSVLLNLLPLEDYFLWCLRIDKPVIVGVEAETTNAIHAKKGRVNTAVTSD